MNPKIVWINQKAKPKCFNLVSYSSTFKQDQLRSDSKLVF